VSSITEKYQQVVVVGLLRFESGITSAPEEFLGKVTSKFDLPHAILRNF